MTSPAHQVVWAASIFLILSLVSVVMYRKQLTPINRRVFDAARFMFLAQTVLALGGWILGTDPAQVQVINIFLWSTLLGTFAINIDRVLALTGVSYYAAILLASRFPEHRLWVMSGANLVFTLTAAWRWRPAAQKFAAQHSVAGDAVIRRRELGD